MTIRDFFFKQNGIITIWNITVRNEIPFGIMTLRNIELSPEMVTTPCEPESLDTSNCNHGVSMGIFFS